MIAAASHAAAETRSCTGDRPPARLWSLNLDAADWSETSLHHVAVADAGRIFAFGSGKRRGDTAGAARPRILAATSAMEGGSATVRELGLPLAAGMELRDISEVVGAVALPDGEAIAAISVSVDGGRKSIRRLVRVGPDGGVRARSDMTRESETYGTVRLVRDGADRFAVLGSAGTPPFVPGIFEAHDFSLRRVAAYAHPANATIFHFARGRHGDYTLFGDWGGQIGRQPEGTGAGRFRVRVAPAGRAGPPRRIGEMLATDAMSSLAFDHRGGTTLLVTDALLWIARDGAVAGRHPLPAWEAGGETFSPEVRLDEAGCALLFSRGGRARLMRMDRAGRILWRIDLRADGGGDLWDVAPVANGFVAAATIESAKGRHGWLARYAYR